MASARYDSFWLAAVLACAALLLSAPAAEARRLAVACSPYVYPCECGLCPRIVDCNAKATAECFCGKAAPGIYPHPQANTKFWMCSYDSQSRIHYGVEVDCPARLVFDPAVKVCTLPNAVTAASVVAERAPANKQAPGGSSKVATAPQAAAAAAARPKMA